jgi:hypothetical protein
MFEEKKDKFREARRAKITNAKCKACRQRDHEERTKKQQAEAAERRKLKPKKTYDPKWKEQIGQGRLPDGSQFHLIYVAGTESWSGELMIHEPSPGEEPVFFAAISSAVYRCLQKLDNQYREWLLKQSGSLVVVEKEA